MLRARSYPKCAFALAVLTMIVAGATEVAAAGETTEYRRLLNDKGPALVTVKFVLKVKMGGMMAGMGDQESENEITGVMINPKGLVLCSNTQFGGFAAVLSRMMGSMAGNITATPTDLKVLIGDDAEGRDAELLARDSELDLVWVKLKEPGDKPFSHVDFTKGVKPEIGQRVIAIRRMGKYFARTVVVAGGWITGVTSKPRDLFVPSTDIAMAHGVPVFTADGRIVGLTVMQMPDEGDVGGNPMALLGRMSNMQEMMTGFILPADEVAKATRRALDSDKSPETE